MARTTGAYPLQTMIDRLSFPVGQEAIMDVHKPKAAHSWREFLIEIGTIICGILIALMLEQVVDALRWRRETDEASEAIRKELALDAAALRGLQSQDVCIDKRLALLADWTQGRARINSANLSSWENRPHLWSLGSSAWDVAKAGGIAAHLPYETRVRLAGIYASIANLEPHIWRERDDWTQLARAEGKASLDPAAAQAIRESISVIRTETSQRRFNVTDLLRDISDYGVRPDRTYPPNLSLCEPPK